MLTDIHVVYENAEGLQTLSLPIVGSSPKDSLLIRKVTGLNPPDLDLHIGDYASDGGVYQGRRVGARNVVMTIDLNPNPALGETVSGLRTFLYKVFVDPLVHGDNVQLVFLTDTGKTITTHGYTEKLESELFDIETLVQISMICPNPYLRDLAPTQLVNPTGTWVSLPFVYDGDAESGFSLEIEVSTATSILNVSVGSRVISFGHDFLPGDVVQIDTNRGSRSATYTRSGVTKSLLAKLAYTSQWIQLHSADSLVSVYGALSTDVVGGIKSMTYQPTYWGL